MTTYIKFEMDGCMPCKMVDQMITHEMPALKDKYNTNGDIQEGMFNIINITNDKSLATEYNVSSVPTFIKLENGKEVERFSGFQPLKLKQIEQDLA